jgi:hypothetical protein
MELITLPRARAYVYAGDWVADCPRQGCGNVEHLFDRSNPAVPASARTVRKTGFFCTYCRLVAEIEWARDEADIMAVLGLRPVPHNRNWYPADHETALRFNIAHGQSVQDLRHENAEHGVAVS